MTRAEFAIELGKYIVTGLITFLASIVYTNYRVEPGRNVSIVPLLIDKRQSCEVVEDKLKAAFEAVGPAPTTPPPKHTYEFYVRNLQQQPSDDYATRRVIFKNAVPEHLLPRLEKEGIFKCTFVDPNGRPDYRYNTLLILHVAILVEEPTVYVLKRSCTLNYDGENIPLRASLEAIPLTGIKDIKAEREMFTIKQTGEFFLQYDGQQAARANQEKFSDLVRKMSEKEIELSVKCSVVTTRGEAEIGGKQKYRVGAAT